jgi:hypothetical protein
MADDRQALQTLYSAPLASFVAERKRLAAALRAAGDDHAARELAQRHRPTASAWAVNQLYWHARDVFDALLATAGRLRKGDLGATGAHRDALAELRKRAAAMLRDAGHAATATTLQRVTGTLSAIAAAGGFDPDPPGALSADREPPGFDAFVPSAREHRPQPAAAASRATGGGAAAAERARVAAARAEDRARKQAETRAREAERHRLKAALRDASAEVQERARAVSARQKELQAAEKALEDARQIVQDLERQLEGLEDAD